MNAQDNVRLRHMGEAASRITPESVDALPQIPWRDIIGMRNVLVHAYFSINLDILWNTVTHSLPLLITELE